MNNYFIQNYKICKYFLQKILQKVFIQNILQKIGRNFLENFIIKFVSFTTKKSKINLQEIWCEKIDFG